MPFPYKNVLVIGATSGIGLALAERLIQNGANVIAVGRRQEILDEFVQKHGKNKATSFQFDITNLAGIPEFAKRVTAAHPEIDSVFLNSGIQRSLDFTKPDSIDLDLVETELNTNYLSYIHLLKYFLPHLQAQKIPTSLIFTSSSLALVPLPRCGNYCASKAALHHLILVVREQLVDTNVKVIEIYPPAVKTELHAAKHQPDLNGGQFGMPLDEFTDAAWAGLENGEEQIPVGMGKMAFEAFETKRQDMFHNLIELIKKSS